MTRKVGIIGVGHVGADTAFSLVTQGLCDVLVLIDENEAKADSQALELRDMASLTASRVQVIANDYAALEDAEVVVIAVGPKTLLREDRLEELAETRAAVSEVTPKIIASGFNGVIINITNPCDVITQVIQKVSRLPHAQVLGTGTSLDTARMKRVVGEFFSVDPKSVNGYVMGEHGESQFVAWSTVNIGGCPVSELAVEGEQTGYSLSRRCAAADGRFCRAKVGPASASPPRRQDWLMPFSPMRKACIRSPRGTMPNRSTSANRPLLAKVALLNAYIQSSQQQRMRPTSPPHESF